MSTPTISLHPSIAREGDEYDNLGRNITAQIRRDQAWGKWVRVRYSRKFY